jgi:hypothetical protein
MISTSTVLPPRIRARYTALSPASIEKTFLTTCVTELGQVVVLDGIDILPDSSGFRIRTHDLFGQLPEIVIQDSADIFNDKGRIDTAACKLIAIVRLRDQIKAWLPKGKFLLPSKLGGQAEAGLRLGEKAWLSEGTDFLVAYHELHRRLLG